MTQDTEQPALTVQTFMPHVEETFTVRLPEAAVPLTLAEALPLGGAGRGGGAFSLIFAGDPALYLPQAIYPLTHPQLGTLEIFLVPLRPDRRGSLFQALFN